MPTTPEAQDSAVKLKEHQHGALADLQRLAASGGVTAATVSIPIELRERPPWVCWKMEARKPGGKPTKVPKCPNTGGNAKADMPETWGTYDAAVKMAEQRGWSGVGFEFSVDDQFVGVDLDNCRNRKTGEIREWAQKIIDNLNSYSEVSPSGNGVKIWVRGKLPCDNSGKADHGLPYESTAADPAGIEAYHQGRYFCITGEHVESTPTTIEYRQADLDDLWKQYFGEQKAKTNGQDAPEFLRNGPVTGLDEIAQQERETKARDIMEAVAVLQTLGADFYNPYSKWLKVGRILHSVNSKAEMRAVWDGWSRNSDKYEPGECAAKWATFTADGNGKKITIATLKKWAREHGAHVGNGKKIGPPPAKAKTGPLPVTYPAKIADALIAEMFTEDDRRTLARHCGEWREWDGTAYREIGEEDFKARVRTWLEAQELVRHKATKDGFEAVPVKANTNATNEVIDATRAIANIPETVKQPTWLEKVETDPEPASIAACSNGLLRLDALELIPHTPRWYSHNCLPFPWQPDAECNAWREFLWDVSCGDDEWILALQLWFGYLLTSDTSQQRMMIFEGPPRSGKGTICRALQRILGEHSYCNPTLSSLAEQFGLASMVGKTAAILADAHLGGRTDSAAIVERLKGIIGEDKQDVQRKFLPTLGGVKLNVRFLMTVNSMVNLPDSADGLTPKCLVLPFEKSYVGREDLTLDDRLAAESSGILAWGVDGLQELRRRGRLVQPERGSEIREDLGRLASPIKAFVEDLCIVDAKRSVFTRMLYKTWSNWCERHGHKPGGDALFGTRLRAVVPGLKRFRRADKDGLRVPTYYRIDVDLQAVTNSDWQRMGHV